MPSRSARIACRVERGDEAQLDEDLTESSTGPALDVESLRELLVGDDPLLDEQVADAAPGRRIGGRGRIDDFVDHLACIDGRSRRIEG